MKKFLFSVGFDYDSDLGVDISLTRLANEDEKKIFEAQDDEECYWDDTVFLVMASSHLDAEDYYEGTMAAQFRLIKRMNDEMDDDDLD